MKKLRPVIVKRQVKHEAENLYGYFHGWGQWGTEDGSDMMGIVEFEDGKCDYYPVTWIQFTDRKG